MIKKLGQEDNLMSNYLKVIKDVNMLQNNTGKNLIKEIKKVPITNVISAFKSIQISDLSEMVMSTSIPNLVEGLTIITPNQIKSIPVDKLKLILKLGKMNTIRRLQYYYGESKIITILNKIPIDLLSNLLILDNFDKIIYQIDLLNII